MSKKTILGSAAIIVALGVLASSIFISPAKAADETWYLGHFGKDVCVPVEDIDSLGERRYYHGGDFTTPEQLILQMAKALGSPVKKRGDLSLTKNGITVTSYELKLLDGKVAINPFINDKAACERLMSAVGE